MEAKLLSDGIRHQHVPLNYIRPESERPQLSLPQCDDVPIIDLAVNDRTLVVNQIRRACQNYGFFQVINHGVSKEITEGTLKVIGELFKLPAEEKMKLYSDDPVRTTRLCTSFNVKKEKLNNWRDYLRLHCYPLQQYVPEWPSNPPSFKEIVSKYCIEVRELGLRIEELISESLGLESDYLRKAVGDEVQGQHMTINYYPPCPQPEMTYGLPAHTDPNTLTILLQDPQVPGLQVLKDGKWLTNNPLPSSFVINVGDQLEALSNGIYKSVWHRAVVNSEKARISVASFLCPASDAFIRAPPLLTDGDGSPPIYRQYTYAEYYDKFWSRSLDEEEHCLEFFKNKHSDVGQD